MTEQKKQKKRIVIVDKLPEKKEKTQKQVSGISLTKEIVKKEDETSYFKDLLDTIPFQKHSYFKRSVCRVDNNQIELIPTLLILVEFLQNNYNVLVKGVFCNLYEGQDFCPYHADSYGTDVYTMSFGDSKEFYTKDNKTKEVTKYLLEDGDILWFSKEWNSENKHSIPKRTRFTGKRISIVFFT